MTTSRPANGFGGFTGADWSDRFGGQDGIIEDYDGHSFDITLLNGTNEAQFAPAKISINGYTLTVLATDRVSLPAPTSGSKTFYIGALYDPALDVPVPVTQGDGTVVQTAAEAGPCRLMAYDGTIDTTGGKRFLVKYTVSRTSAPLTGAAVADRRRWVGVSVESPVGLPASAPGTDGVYPRGSVLTTPGRVYVRTLNKATPPVLDWVDAVGSGPFPFPFASGYVARNISGNKVTYSRRAGLVKLTGDVQKSSGSISSEVTLGYLPAGYRPATTERFVCKTSGGGGQCEVRIDPTTGAVISTDNGQTFSWINLSPVIFEAGN